MLEKREPKTLFRGSKFHFGYSCAVLFYVFGSLMFVLITLQAVPLVLQGKEQPILVMGGVIFTLLATFAAIQKGQAYNPLGFSELELHETGFTYSDRLVDDRYIKWDFVSGIILEEPNDNARRFIVLLKDDTRLDLSIFWVDEIEELELAVFENIKRVQTPQIIDCLDSGLSWEFGQVSINKHHLTLSDENVSIELLTHVQWDSARRTLTFIARSPVKYYSVAISKVVNPVLLLETIGRVNKEVETQTLM